MFLDSGRFRVRWVFASSMAADGEIWLVVRVCLLKVSAKGMFRVKGRRVRMAECGWFWE